MRFREVCAWTIAIASTGGASYLCIQRVDLLLRARQKADEIMLDAARQSAVRVDELNRGLADLADKTAAASEAHRIVEEQIHELHPGIIKIKFGMAVVNREYVTAVEVIPRSETLAEIKVTLEAFTRTRPDFRVFLIDRIGFVTGEVHEEWILDTIEPGERRVIRKPVSLRAGQPVYLTIEFE